MTLAAFFLAAVLAPQETAAAQAPAAEPKATEARTAGAAQEYIDAGLKAFKRHRLSAAQAEFQKAVDADPQNAEATYYLAYAYYKIAEPSRRLTPGKRKAAELFAKAFALDPVFHPAWGPKG